MHSLIFGNKIVSFDKQLFVSGMYEYFQVFHVENRVSGCFLSDFLRLKIRSFTYCAGCLPVVPLHCQKEIKNNVAVFNSQRGISVFSHKEK